MPEKWVLRIELSIACQRWGLASVLAAKETDNLAWEHRVRKIPSVGQQTWRPSFPGTRTQPPSSRLPILPSSPSSQLLRIPPHSFMPRSLWVSQTPRLRAFRELNWWEHLREPQATERMEVYLISDIALLPLDSVSPFGRLSKSDFLFSVSFPL